MARVTIDAPGFPKYRQPTHVITEYFDIDDICVAVECNRTANDGVFHKHNFFGDKSTAVRKSQYLAYEDSKSVTKQ